MYRDHSIGMITHQESSSLHCKDVGQLSRTHERSSAGPNASFQPPKIVSAQGNVRKGMLVYLPDFLPLTTDARLGNALGNLSGCRPLEHRRKSSQHKPSRDESIQADCITVPDLSRGELYPGSFRQHDRSCIYEQLRGSKEPTLHMEIMEIMRWVEQLLLSLRAIHIKGT